MCGKVTREKIAAIILQDSQSSCCTAAVKYGIIKLKFPVCTVYPRTVGFHNT